ncbi:hypothetical protein C7M84_002970 [Penaeus vannamei]|uniref:Uncharacterized protein n=1 Tax=Penaeus vannamei TaxID=6689 RepID=A0A3R7MJG6_PENVA|nr:hypothetical protein C7M84_002970 [Penaeus vannamei]
MPHEQLEGGESFGTHTSAKVRQPEPARDARVPVNGQVVHIPLSPVFSSATSASVILVNGSSSGSKRSVDLATSPSSDKKRIRENAVNEQIESEQRLFITPLEDNSLPLDLSCRGPVVVKNCGRPAAASTPEPTEHLNSLVSIVKDEFNNSDTSEPCPTEPLNQTVLSDRGPLEDENENLVNEAREKEKAFFNTAQNEQYLTEDSTGLDPPPPLPLYGAGGALRRMRVSSDDGPPMVYSVRLYAEQVLVSRILGVNEETGYFTVQAIWKNRNLPPLFTSISFNKVTENPHYEI